MSVPAPPSPRRLGLTSAVALVVANMIGAGVFTTSGFALADLGTPERVLAAWAIGGAIALCGAISYGALVRRFPESGGEYVLLARTVHPLAGFLAGWVSLLAGFTAPIALAGLGLAAYLGPWLGEDVPPEWIGTLAIAAAAAMHASRAGGGVLLQNFAVGLKLLLIAGLVAIGAGAVRAGVAAPATPDARPFDAQAFAVALVWISFSYSGWNAAAYVAGEVRDPDRNLSRSLWGGALAVTLVYLALNAVFVYAAPVAELAGRPEVGAVAAEAIGGARLRNAVSALVALALFTSISGMVMAGPRVYAKMARDGLFPGLRGPGEEVPARAVVLQGALAILVLWIGDLRELLGYIGFTLGVSAAGTVCGLLVQRRREGPARVPIPGFPFVPLLYVGATLGASGFLVAREPAQALWGLGTVAVGAPVYALLLALRQRRA